ncbi:hypothetical protein L7F22_029331 [Adiantum nelumboides]|nr:hypothetical protein [Adiantum nelumboides]
MFPSWFSKRRDMQKVKQKRSGGPLLPYPNGFHQRYDDNTVEPPKASFAKALSLHKDISRARASHLKAELAGFLASRKDPDANRNSHVSTQDDMQCAESSSERCARSQRYPSQGESSTHTSTGAHSDVSSMPAFLRSGTGESTFLASDDITLNKNPTSLDFFTDSGRPGLCLQIGVVNDNDTEDSTILTPDSNDSSFGSGSSSVGIFECASCSLVEGGVPILDSNLGLAVELLKRHQSSCSIVEAESPSLFNSDVHLRNDCCDFLACSTLLENSLSFATSSVGESGVGGSSPGFVGNGSHAINDMQKKFNSAEEIRKSDIFERILSNTNWEESSALIAAENPSLMLSSKWQEERSVGSCFSEKENARSIVTSDGESNVCKDGEYNVPFCDWPHDSSGLLVSGLKDCCNGLPEDELKEEGSVGYHKSKHDAYIRNGRGHRGSSFSAALPEKLQDVVGDSVALVKMSDTPYEDFRQSMYEMIMEQDFEEDPMDVEERLLQCYLTLNSPELHPLIKEVFSDVWSSILMNVR